MGNPIAQDVKFKWTHWCGFRCGREADVIGVKEVTPDGHEPRIAFEVEYPDGTVDYAPLSDYGLGNFDIYAKAPEEGASEGPAGEYGPEDGPEEEATLEGMLEELKSAAEKRKGGDLGSLAYVIVTASTAILMAKGYQLSANAEDYGWAGAYFISVVVWVVGVLRHG